MNNQDYKEHFETIFPDNQQLCLAKTTLDSAVATQCALHRMIDNKQKMEI